MRSDGSMYPGAAQIGAQICLECPVNEVERKKLLTEGYWMIRRMMVCDSGMFGMGVIMHSDGSMYSGAAQVRAQVT